ncbi:hypothetical protein D081_2348 [Anaerovibrio sp. JC8]|uniref:hypothetical protein n=1 Tax=Anaerovibrio sp. JC8 TaxID=1240085 RepID=UPI000A0C1D72|nr:hypothetical protein [Anaerovibrio sp. JC8]ORT98898.1 hypothetical protein D081_2348 [Anaerovibrio sp. JC8]
MAIKTPTPPTPPTPPVSPKGQDNSNAEVNTGGGGTTETGDKEFGIHINISNPNDKKEKSQNSQQNAAGDGGNQVQKEVITKERDQLPEPQAVLTGDMPADKVLQTEARQPDNEALHLNNNSSTFGGISIWPFVLVFVAAFIGFTLLNIMKNKQELPIKEKQISPQQETDKEYTAKATDSATKNKDDDDHKHFEIRI